MERILVEFEEVIQSSMELEVPEDCDDIETYILEEYEDLLRDHGEQVIMKIDWH